MKFLKKFKESRVPEWSNFYIDYKKLRKFITPYKELSNVYLKMNVKRKQGGFRVNNLPEQGMEVLQEIHIELQRIFSMELVKVFHFYSQIVDGIVKKWKTFKINQMIYREAQESEKDQNKHFYMLKEAFYEIYKECKYIKRFLSLNQEAFEKILTKFIKYGRHFHPDSELQNIYDNAILGMRVHEMKNKFNGFQHHIENEYSTFFYKNKKDGNKSLKTLMSEKIFTRNELYTFGLFSGLTVAMLIVMIFMSWEGGLDIDGVSSFAQIFPVMRGAILIILYMWLFCACVYGWNASNTNYKTTLKFNHHYSTLTEMMKRTSIFTFIFLICFLWYFLISQESGKLSDGLDFVSEHIPPLFWWILFLGYLFFPSKTKFNGEGRMYLFKTVKDFLLIKNDSRISYFLMNMITFIYVFRDIQFTFCYYITLFAWGEDELAQCDEIGLQISSLFLVNIPMFVELCQLYKSRKTAPKFTSIFWTLTDFIFIGLSILGYFLVQEEDNATLVTVWVVISAIITVLLIFADFYDWGFYYPLKKYKKIRKELMYGTKWFYWFALSFSVFARFFSVITIYPDILTITSNPQLFTLISSLFSFIRRNLWSLMYIKKKHFINVGELRACNEIIWPYPELGFQEDFDDDNILGDDLVHMFDTQKKFKDLSMIDNLDYKEQAEQNNDLSMYPRQNGSQSRRHRTMVKSQTRREQTMVDIQARAEAAYFVKNLNGMVAQYLNAEGIKEFKLEEHQERVKQFDRILRKIERFSLQIKNMTRKFNIETQEDPYFSNATILNEFGDESEMEPDFENQELLAPPPRIGVRQATSIRKAHFGGTNTPRNAPPSRFKDNSVGLIDIPSNIKSNKNDESMPVPALKGTKVLDLNVNSAVDHARTLNGELYASRDEEVIPEAHQEEEISLSEGKGHGGLKHPGMSRKKSSVVFEDDPSPLRKKSAHFDFDGKDDNSPLSSNNSPKKGDRDAERKDRFNVRQPSFAPTEEKKDKSNDKKKGSSTNSGENAEDEEEEVIHLQNFTDRDRLETDDYFFASPRSDVALNDRKN